MRSWRIVVLVVTLTVVLVVLGVMNGFSEVESNELYDVGPWARTLAAHQHKGGVDYASLKKDRGDLDSYLKALSISKPQQWDRAEQVAFWSNAYNAVVLHHVLEKYPDIRSVKNVPGFFDELKFEVAGCEMTLDEIEAEARELGDPRVHFAVVCASTSCPDLQSQPFKGKNLESQLEYSTRSFLEDPQKGLLWLPDENTLQLSSIFKWYAGDFTGGSTVVAYFVRSRILNWVTTHLPRALSLEINESDPKVKYLDYDWQLNDRPRYDP